MLMDRRSKSVEEYTFISIQNRVMMKAQQGIKSIPNTRNVSYVLLFLARISCVAIQKIKDVKIVHTPYEYEESNTCRERTMLKRKTLFLLHLQSNNLTYT